MPLSALLLESLRLAVARDPLRPRVLVTASAATGAMLLRRLAASGTAWMNVSCESTLGLARRLAQVPLARAGLIPVDRALRLLAVDRLLATVADARAYFGRVPRTPGVAAAVLSALDELRLGGAAAEAVRAAATMPGRGEALAALLPAYERLLRERGWADAADIFRLAADGVAARGVGSTVVLLPESLAPEGLEGALLATLPAASVVRLGTDAPDVPHRAAAPGTATRAGVSPGPLHSVVATGGPVPDLEVAFAASPLAEVRSALRRILSLGVPFDDVELILASETPHLRLVREETTRLGLPCTFGPGCPVAWTAPGRALEAYLIWLRDDFPARVLADVLAAGDLRLPEAGTGAQVTGTAAARILRRAGIGWGRERYLPGLRAYAASLEFPDPDAEDPNAKARAARMAAVGTVAAAVGDLLTRTPAPDARGGIEVGQLCEAAAHLLRTLGPEGAAGGPLVERLEAATPWMGEREPPADAVARVLALVADLRIGAALAAPGCIHVSLGGGGGVTGRGHTFLLGLDEGALGTAALDPVLSDVARRRLGLPTGGEQAARHLDDFRRMLAGLRGRIHASYAAADPGGGRRGFPSPLLLQIFRVREGRGDLDYSALAAALGAPAAAHLPGALPPLDRSEAWLGGIAASGVSADARRALFAALPRLRRGQALRDARRSPEVTPFDGQVTPDPSLDPRRNPDLVVSAHRLELLGRCPLAYFLQYVLGVRPLEETEREPGVWLDARERGSLLHAIYSRHLQAAGERGAEAPESRERLRAAGKTCLAEWRERIPPPSEAVFALEAAEVLASLDVFLAMERAETGDRPVLFELAFGMPDEEAPAGAVPLPAARIPVAGGEIWLRGRIDRVDLAGPGEFRIWDYKTGRLWTGAYPDAGLVARGRLLQHALYAAAGPQVLAAAGHPGARILSSGYRFPTERGEGERWLPAGEPAQALGEAVGALLDLAAAGTFVAAEDAHNCRYCDFRDACERERAAEATAAKLEAGDPRLDPLRVVQGHA